MNELNSSLLGIDLINILTFLPLVVSFLIFNKTPKPISLILISTTLVTALIGGIVDYSSAFFLLGFGAICYLFDTTKQKLFKTISGILVFILTIVLMSHMLPGINNPIIINNHYFSESAVPYTKYLNIDKAIAGLLLLLYVVPKPKNVSYENSIIAVLVTTLFISISFLIATSFGLVNIDPKFSVLIIPWALTNLFFTCYVEEAFFRGFIQERISILLVQYKFNYLIAILTSGILFGLVHLPAGLIYTAIATLTGCSLAYIYYRTKNIYWPIYAHFTFNLIHFVLFTYPYLK